MTRETVWCETPASRATSKMLAVRPGPVLPPARRRGSLIELVRSARPARVSESTVSVVGRHGVDDPAVRAGSRPGAPTRSTSSSSAEMNITDRPLSASSPTRFWTSTFAPDVDPAGGLVQDQRARVTARAGARAGPSAGCRRTACPPAGRGRPAGCPARRPSCARARAAGPGGSGAGCRAAACSASVMFSRTLSSLMMPSVVRFSEE